MLFRPLGDADHSGGSLGAWEASAPTLEESSSWGIGKPGALQGCLPSWAESRGKFACGRLVGRTCGELVGGTGAASERQPGDVFTSSENRAAWI